LKIVTIKRHSALTDFDAVTAFIKAAHMSERRDLAKVKAGGHMGKQGSLNNEAQMNGLPLIEITKCLKMETIYLCLP
jgi:hypothetical protein